MLVHRVVVVHVELHHRDDAAEIRDKAAEQAGFVHAPEHHLRRAPSGQDLQEDAVGLRLVAQARRDQPERLRYEAAGIRVDGEVLAAGDGVEPEQVDRIALEGAVVDHIEALARQLEVDVSE